MSPRWLANPDRETPLHLAPVSRAEWEGFLLESAGSFLYHSWEWLEFLRSEYAFDWHPLGIWCDDTLVGLFPVMARRLGPFRLAGSPLMQVIASTPFLGPVTAPGQFQDIGLALEGFLHHYRFAHFEISLPYRLSETERDWAQKQGYTPETCEAVFLNLKGQGSLQLWEGLSTSCRRAIRKARAYGVDIIHPQADTFLETYSVMCQEVYRGSGRLPHLSASFYSHLLETFKNKNWVYCLLATYQGQIIAGAIFLLHRQYACYLSGASFDQWQFLRPNNLLQWHFIEWAASQGYETYDMGGIAHPGITRFKLSFGGQIISYTRLHRANRLVARLGRQIYQSALPLWRNFQARTTHK